MKVVILILGINLIALGTHEAPFWLRTLCWFIGGGLLGYYQSLMEKAIEDSKFP